MVDAARSTAPTATRAVVVPTLGVLLVTVVTLTTYHHLWRVAPTAVHRSVATVAGLIAFIAIGFGPLVIYLWGRHGGAPLRLVVAACFVTPVCWNVKEMIRVTEYFTVGEALYYGLNTVFLLTVFGAIGQMGLGELLYRRRQRAGAGGAGAMVTAGPLLAIGVAVAAFFTLLAWGGGVHAFYIYVEGYRALFGSGYS